MLTRVCSVIFIVMIATSTSNAATDRPLRQAKSANGRFQLRIEAGRPDREGRGKNGQREDAARQQREGADGRDSGGGVDSPEGAEGEQTPDETGAAGGDEPANDDAADVAGEEIPAWPTNLGERGDGDQAEGRELGEGQPAVEEDAREHGGRGRQGRAPVEARGVQARLVDREARGAARLCWEARLMNEVSPTQAFIHDEGRWVVTLDDYGRGGAAHAVVVYDARGEVLRDFELEELLSIEDRGHVRERGEALEWLTGAQCRFVPEPERFVIKLRWEREIWIDLESGELTDETEIAAEDEGAWLDALAAADEETAQDEGEEHPSQEELAARLHAEIAAADANNAQISVEFLEDVLAQAQEGQTGELPPEAQEAIKQALHQAIGEALQKAITDNVAEQIAGQVGDPAEQPTSAPAEIRLELNFEGGILSYQVHIPEFRLPQQSEVLTARDFGPPLAVYTPPGSSEPLFLTPAGNSATVGGVAVPQADPKNPINYIAWMNQQAATAGPSAAPLLEAAGQAVVNYDGPVELEAAIDGDLNALSSPEIAGWVEANRAAMDQAVAATQLEYRGMPAKSDDGMVVGVLLPNLANMRQIAKAMVTDGKRLELLDQQPQAAVDRYMQVLEVGAQQSQGPTLIENLVGNAVQRLGSNALLDSFANAGDALDYESVAQQLEQRYKPLRPVAETMQYERVMVLDVVQRAFEYDEASGGYRVNPDGAKLLASVQGMTGGGHNNPIALMGSMLALNSVGFEDTLARANQHYDELTVASQAPYSEGREMFNELERRVEDPTFRTQNPLLATMLPSLGRAGALSAQAEATRRATNVVARVKAYRQRNGSYPASLEEIGIGSNAIDPFTGQPFVYSSDGSDFSLYSVGLDGVDNAGADWDRQQNTGDLRFWPRPVNRPNR